ncbi:MAG: Hsp20/alpha crystallin family protein [Acidimicrobiaceae bacterium]|nr:Hsp20/alpha crystallin family protein [Acidimicrobiaceae bacterium]
MSEMSLMPFGWDPWSDLNHLSQTMDRLFGSVSGSGGQGGGSRTMYLPINLMESDTGYTLEAPVAGFKPEEVDVTFQDGLLSIKAEHKEEASTNQGQALRREFLWADSVRQINLPGEIDAEKIEATVRDGLLRVTVPKASSAQPRRIPIGGGQARAELTGTPTS